MSFLVARLLSACSRQADKLAQQVLAEASNQCMSIAMNDLYCTFWLHLLYSCYIGFTPVTLILLLLHWLYCCLSRQKRDLEEVSVAMQEEKAKLQQEADNLAQQLQAVLSDKFVPRTGFDAETPIDKTLGYLESVIGVSPRLCS